MPDAPILRLRQDYQLAEHVLVSSPEQVAFDFAQLPRLGNRDEAAIGPFGR